MPAAHGSHLVLLLLAGANVADGNQMKVAWASGTAAIDDDSAEALAMICYPAASSCGSTTADWVVHKVNKVDVLTSGRLTVNTLAYPKGGLPDDYKVGPCAAGLDALDATDENPAVETFSMTYVNTGAANNEIGGAPFTTQTDLIRRTNVNWQTPTGK